VIVGNGKHIDIYSYEGEIKSKVELDSTFGEITNFNTLHNFLLVTCGNNFFGIYDIIRRNFKQILTFRRFEKNGKLIGEIRDVSINSRATCVGILCDQMANSELRIPETKFYIYDCENDFFYDYEISSNRIPIEILWDYNDSRLFGVQTEYAKDISEINSELTSEDVKKGIFTALLFF